MRSFVFAKSRGKRLEVFHSLGFCLQIEVPEHCKALILRREDQKEGWNNQSQLITNRCPENRKKKPRRQSPLNAHHWHGSPPKRPLFRQTQTARIIIHRAAKSVQPPQLHSLRPSESILARLALDPLLAVLMKGHLALTLLCRRELQVKLEFPSELATAEWLLCGQLAWCWMTARGSQGCLPCEGG